MRPQLTRLVIVFSITFGALIAARVLLVPETFGDKGHFRAAAIGVEASHPIKYAGRAACSDCHADIADVHGSGFHKGLSCEICHNPSAGHADNPLELQPDKPRGRDLCELCHSYDPARPTGFPQIEPALHNPRQSCSVCHEPHAPVTPVTPEGCGGCHGQIARTKAVSHHATLACTLCHETSEEHRLNPAASTPGKPSTRSFCGGCHATGATPPANIVQEVPRVDMDSHGEHYVCWQCHYPHFPELK